MADNQKDQHATSVEADFAIRLAEEYKILQDKIDRIGAFRFTIKGWSITVIIASVLAGTATNAAPRWLWGFSLLVFVIAFFLYERQQTSLSHHFGQRLLRIEAALSRQLRKAARNARAESVTSSFMVLHFVPGIGHHLSERHSNRRRRRTFWTSFREADVYFYMVQAAVVFAFLLWGATSRPEYRNSTDVPTSSSTSSPAPSTNAVPSLQISPSAGEVTRPQLQPDEEEKQANQEKKRNHQ